MIEVATWCNAHRFGDSLAQHHRLRHECFVERNGWSVPSLNGMEYDQFDTASAVYLMCREPGRPVLGTARLLPTTRPYMLQQLWPDLLNGAIPAESHVWEATRFAVSEELSAAEKQRVASEIVLGCLEYGCLTGITRYLVLMPPLIIRRTIGGMGCKIRFLGESRSLAPYPVSAAEISVDAETLAHGRRKAGYRCSILNMGLSAEQAA